MIDELPDTHQSEDYVMVEPRDRPVHSARPPVDNQRDGQAAGAEAADDSDELAAIRRRLRHLEKEVRRLQPLEAENRRLQQCMGGLSVLGRALKEAKTEIKSLKTKLHGESDGMSRESDDTSSESDVGEAMADTEALGQACDSGVVQPEHNRGAVGLSKEPSPTDHVSDTSGEQDRERGMDGDEGVGGAGAEDERPRQTDRDGGDGAVPDMEGAGSSSERDEAPRRGTETSGPAKATAEHTVRSGADSGQPGDGAAADHASDEGEAPTHRVPLPASGEERSTEKEERQGKGEMVEETGGKEEGKTEKAEKAEKEWTEDDNEREGDKGDRNEERAGEEEKEEVYAEANEACEEEKGEEEEAEEVEGTPPAVDQTERSQSQPSSPSAEVTAKSVDGSFVYLALSEERESRLREEVNLLKKVNRDWERFWERKRSDQAGRLRAAQATAEQLQQQLDTAQAENQRLESQLALEKTRNDKTDKLNRVLAKQNSDMTAEIQRLKEALERNHSKKAAGRLSKPKGSDRESTRPTAAATPADCRPPPPRAEPLPPAPRHSSRPLPLKIIRDELAGEEPRRKEPIKGSPAPAAATNAKAADSGNDTNAGQSEKSLTKQELKEQYELLRQQNQMYESDFKKERKERVQTAEKLQKVNSELRHIKLQARSPRYPGMQSATVPVRPRRIEEPRVRGYEVGEPKVMNALFIEPGANIQLKYGDGLLEMGRRNGRNHEPFQCPRCQRLFQGSDWENYEHHVFLCNM